MTVFVNFLFLMAIVLALALIGAIFWIALTSFAKRRALKRGERLEVVNEEEKRGWKGVGWKGMSRRGSGPFISVLRAGSLRLLLVAWYPLALFTFYQWTIGTTDVGFSHSVEFSSKANLSRIIHIVLRTNHSISLHYRLHWSGATSSLGSIGHSRSTSMAIQLSHSSCILRYRRSWTSRTSSHISIPPDSCRTSSHRHS